MKRFLERREDKRLVLSRFERSQLDMLCRVADEDHFDMFLGCI